MMIETGGLLLKKQRRDLSQVLPPDGVCMTALRGAESMGNLAGLQEF